MRYILAVVVAMLAVLLASPAHAADAGTVRLEPPTRAVAHVKVTSVQQVAGPNIRIRFNTGSRWSVRPCRHEDGNNCYWDARKHGNGQGRSFVTLKGKTYYSRLIRS